MNAFTNFKNYSINAISVFIKSGISYFPFDQWLNCHAWFCKLFSNQLIVMLIMWYIQKYLCLLLQFLQIQVKHDISYFWIRRYNIEKDFYVRLWWCIASCLGAHPCVSGAAFSCTFKIWKVGGEATSESDRAVVIVYL